VYLSITAAGVLIMVVLGLRSTVALEARTVLLSDVTSTSLDRATAWLVAIGVAVAAAHTQLLFLRVLRAETQWTSILASLGVRTRVVLALVLGEFAVHALVGGVLGVVVGGALLVTGGPLVHIAPVPPGDLMVAAGVAILVPFCTLVPTGMVVAMGVVRPVRSAADAR
jgi:hypothetical protein